MASSQFYISYGMRQERFVEEVAALLGIDIIMSGNTLVLEILEKLRTQELRLQLNDALDNIAGLRLELEDALGIIKDLEEYSEDVTEWHDYERITALRLKQ